MSTVSSAPITQSPLTDPEKSRKIRLCPAVFVTFGLLFAELILYFFINRTFGFTYYNFLLYPNYDQEFFEVVIYNIVIPAFYFLALTALIIVFFTKKRNLILPVVLFFIFTIPEILYCVLDFIYYFKRYDFRYDIIILCLLSFISLSWVILKFSIPAVSFLFLLKPPKKKILKNLLIFLIPAVYFIFYFVTKIIYGEINGYFRYVISEAVFIVPLTSLLFFFVLRWLANPYKKDKKSAPQIKVVQPAAPIPPAPQNEEVQLDAPIPSAPQNEEVQPAAPIPSAPQNEEVQLDAPIPPAPFKQTAPPVPPVVAVERPAVINRPAPVKPEPIVFAPPDVGSKHIADADAIQKYKDLLDNGALTQEEFDAVKKRILNI